MFLLDVQFLLHLQSEGAEGDHPPPEVLMEGRAGGGVVHTLLKEQRVVDGWVKPRNMEVSI